MLCLFLLPLPDLFRFLSMPWNLLLYSMYVPLHLLGASYFKIKRQTTPAPIVHCFNYIFYSNTSLLYFFFFKSFSSNHFFLKRPFLSQGSIINDLSTPTKVGVGSVYTHHPPETPHIGIVLYWVCCIYLPCICWSWKLKLTVVFSLYRHLIEHGSVECIERACRWNWRGCCREQLNVVCGWLSCNWVYNGIKTSRCFSLGTVVD